MRPLERSPGVDPGFPDCAARACPLHAARVYDYAGSLCSVILAPVRFPGVRIHQLKENWSGRADSNRPSGAKRVERPASGRQKCKERQLLTPDKGGVRSPRCTEGTGSAESCTGCR